MTEVRVIEELMDAMWWRKLHVMADSEDALAPYQERVPGWAVSKTLPDDMKLFHLRAAWQVREPINLPVPLGIWRMVAWWVGDDKLSKAMQDGGLAFALAYGVDAMYAFAKHLPPKADEFADVHGITLVRANWVPDGFIAVARGGMQLLDKDW